MAVYGYCRVSTKKQELSRQINNIQKTASDSIIFSDKFTGTTLNRPQWAKLMKRVKAGDTIIFDEVSRMSRDAEQGFQIYEKLFNAGVNLVFLKEPQINTDTYKKAFSKTIELTGTAVDLILNGVNAYLLELAKEQIKLAFQQAQKERDFLSQRTKEGMQANGATNITDFDGKIIELGKIATSKVGRKIITAKSEKAKEVILKHSKSFNGTLSDSDVIKLAGVSRNSYYKYKSELKNSSNEENYYA